MSNKKLTLYDLNTGCDEFGNFAKLVANLMAVEYEEVLVDKEKDTKNFKKSFNGKFPVLELQDGKTCLCEPLSIAKFLASDKYEFYGPDPIKKAQVD